MQTLDSYDGFAYLPWQADSGSTMKTYVLSFALSLEHVPANPERVTYRNVGGSASLNFDIEYKTWPSVGAMRTALDMQGRRAPNSRDWKAWTDSRMARKLLA